MSKKAIEEYALLPVPATAADGTGGASVGAGVGTAVGSGVVGLCVRGSTRPQPSVLALAVAVEVSVCTTMVTIR